MVYVAYVGFLLMACALGCAEEEGTMVKEADGMRLGAGRTSMHDTVRFVQIVEAAEDRDGDHTHHLLGDDMPLGLDLKEHLVHAVQRDHHMLHVDPHLALARASIQRLVSVLRRRRAFRAPVAR